MKHAFDIQNEFGRLCDEAIYQNELVFRCQQDGIETLAEATILLEHQDFKKLHFIDLLAASGGVYELKTARALNKQNELQLINYLLLTGTHHGKLINFRPPAVEYRFVSTSLTPKDRFAFSINTQKWRCADDESAFVQEQVVALLEDWGAFLGADLYKQAIVHLLGGEERVLCPVQMLKGGRLLGKQNIIFLNPTTSLHISAVSKNLSSYERHLQKALNHTTLKNTQWINFNKHTIQMITLQK